MGGAPAWDVSKRYHNDIIFGISISSPTPPPRHGSRRHPSGRLQGDFHQDGAPDRFCFPIADGAAFFAQEVFQLIAEEAENLRSHFVISR
jgi:hypothetical protein